MEALPRLTRPASTKDSESTPIDLDIALSPQTRFVHRIETVAAMGDSPSVLRPSNPPPVQHESRPGNVRSSTTRSSSRHRTSQRPPKAVGQGPPIDNGSLPN